MSAAWGVYVHVPWCRRRCPYCAFYVEVDRDAPYEAFVDRVLREHAARRPAFTALAPRPATVFLGGGTPSRLPAAALARLIAGLDAAPGAEISAECNPEDCTPDWLDAALAAGVTRVSLGLQTLDPRFARLLNRAGTVGQARDAIGRLRSAPLRSFSVDLIFGLPEQTLEDVEADLDAIVAEAPPHVSLYGLTIEPGTPFERAVARGRLIPADEDRWRAMYDRIVARLEGAGWERYEVSNFARPGHRSRHNQLYWSDAPYLGLGPSAHGYLPDGARYHDVADLAAYLEREDPTAEWERPTPEQAAADLLVSTLRGVDGVDLDRLAARTGLAPRADAVDRLVATGLLARAGRRLRLTRDGFPVADAVIGHLSERLSPADGWDGARGGL